MKNICCKTNWFRKNRENEKSTNEELREKTQQKTNDKRETNKENKKIIPTISPPNFFLGKSKNDKSKEQKQAKQEQKHNLFDDYFYLMAANLF